MRRFLKSLSQKFALFSLGVVCLFQLLCFFGLRINLSHSIPQGLYWLDKKAAFTKGNYLLFCPPETSVFQEAKRRGYLNPGFCSQGYGSLMKKLFAIDGDVISIDEKGVSVNEHLLAHSQPLLYDGQGRGLPRLRVKSLRLDRDSLLLMTDQSPISFDARYFGLIARAHILGVLKPLLIWPRL